MILSSMKGKLWMGLLSNFELNVDRNGWLKSRSNPAGMCSPSAWSYIGELSLLRPALSWRSSRRQHGV